MRSVLSSFGWVKDKDKDKVALDKDKDEEGDGDDDNAINGDSRNDDEGPPSPSPSPSRAPPPLSPPPSPCAPPLNDSEQSLVSSSASLFVSTVASVVRSAREIGDASNWESTLVSSITSRDGDFEVLLGFCKRGRFVQKCVERDLPPNLVHCLRLLRVIEVKKGGRASLRGEGGDGESEGKSDNEESSANVGSADADADAAGASPPSPSSMISTVEAVERVTALFCKVRVPLLYISCHMPSPSVQGLSLCNLIRQVSRKR